MRIKTEDAKCTIFNQYVDARGLVIRDEIPIYAPKFARLVVNDKDKIAKDQTIALTYDSEDDLDKDYELLLNKNVIESSNDINSVNSEINNLTRNINCGEKCIRNIYQLVLNKEKVINNSTKKQFKETKLNRPYFQEIKSTHSGSFSYFVDGFENDLCLSTDLSNVNFDKYKYNRKLDENILGKIVTGRKCIIICDKSVELKDIFYLKFGTSDNETQCQLLESIDGRSVFEAEINDDLINLRLENVKIKIGSYKGFKIPKSSVYDENGLKGVFVVDRKILHFKEIDIKYECDGFVICEFDETKANQLQENDIVVTSGRNLYDGKVLMH